MATAAEPIAAPVILAKITSNGRITVPAEIRKLMGIKPGDHLRFEKREDGIWLVRDIQENPFEKWRGAGIPGIAPGREGVVAFMRELRGYDEYDDSIA
jgi:AbrB family looped-hinge helix DNA binding protein